MRRGREKGERDDDKERRGRERGERGKEREERRQTGRKEWIDREREGEIKRREERGLRERIERKRERERKRKEERRKGGGGLTSTISVLEYLVGVCSAGWITKTCTRVFSFRSRPGASRSLQASEGERREKEKKLTHCPEGKLSARAGK